MNTPTVVIGKTQGGKTYRAFELSLMHDGPVVFADVQWRSYRPMTIVNDLAGVVSILSSWKMRSPPPRIDWRLDNYDDFGDFFEYVYRIHRGAHERGVDLPYLLVILDEAWRIAPRGADAKNPAVRVFTEGLQHRIVGCAISQWTQLSHLIMGNAYEWFLFSLWERDVEILRRDYGMEIPDPAWTTDPREYHYWRYDGTWHRGDENGMEVEWQKEQEQYGSLEPLTDD